MSCPVKLPDAVTEAGNHLPAAALYTKAWPFVGVPDICVSVKSESVEEPPLPPVLSTGTQTDPLYCNI